MPRLFRSLPLLALIAYNLARSTPAPAATVAPHPERAVHGAITAIDLPPPAMMIGDAPYPFGWLQDGRLWTMGPDRTFLVSAPPYRKFSLVGMGKGASAVVSWVDDVSDQDRETRSGMDDSAMFLSPNGEWCAPDQSDPMTYRFPLAWSVKNTRIVRWSTRHPKVTWWQGSDYVQSLNWWKRDSSGVYSLLTGEAQSRLLFTPVARGGELHGTVEVTGIPLTYTSEDVPGHAHLRAGEFSDGRLFFHGPCHDDRRYQITTWIVDPTGKLPSQQSTWTPFSDEPALGVTEPAVRIWSDVVLAPDGKRLAWICHVERGHSQREAPDRSTTCEVYITDLQGRHARSIAQVPDAGRGWEAPLCDLAWLPNGRGVSVLYDGIANDKDARHWKLYIIPT